MTYQYSIFFLFFEWYSGKHPCLICHANSDEIQLPPTERTSIMRTLETLDRDLKKFQEEFGGDSKMAKLANNVIGERLFNVSLDQVINLSDKKNY